MAGLVVSPKCSASAPCHGGLFVSCFFRSRKIQRWCCIWIPRPTTRTIRTKTSPASCSELFTLGEGHYTETYIKEATRAFTGWHVTKHLGASVIFNHRHHDAGLKHVLGKIGAFGGDDILALALDQPACARYVTAKLWREFDLYPIKLIPRKSNGWLCCFATAATRSSRSYLGC